MEIQFTLEESVITHNWIVKANGWILDSCRKKRDALKVKRWFETQLETNPKKPGESWRNWEARHLQTPRNLRLGNHYRQKWRTFPKNYPSLKMILVDWQIEMLCNGETPGEIKDFYELLGYQLPDTIKPMVENYAPQLINPASLDLRVGRFCLLRTDFGWEEIDLDGKTEKFPHLIQPGDRLLIPTVEWFNLPNFVRGVFYLKSSRAREFYEHLHAGFCDPGWHNSNLTMEIFNADLDPLPLWHKQPLGQMEFQLTIGFPMEDYSKTGRYNNDRQAQPHKKLPEEI